MRRWFQQPGPPYSDSWTMPTLSILDIVNFSAAFGARIMSSCCSILRMDNPSLNSLSRRRKSLLTTSTSTTSTEFVAAQVKQGLRLFDAATFQFSSFGRARTGSDTRSASYDLTATFLFATSLARSGAPHRSSSCRSSRSLRTMRTSRTFRSRTYRISLSPVSPG